ncbi:MAG TPA: BadF/BadG/BcrA/BcrD ATPase family protein [Intrasporangium sp.]|uniref:N-acetylglucosamine kinase n=1 Tax=Intrasporangium sp. TaxID=1925024 RepID=UPI002F95F21C
MIVAVDVGGSGLRLQSYAAGLGPVRTAPGARVGSTGIDVPSLVADAGRLLDAEGHPEAPEVVVWSMRGLLFLADRAEVLAQVREGLGGRRTVVVSDAVASLVGAVSGLRPGAVVAAGTGAVAFGTDFERHWKRVDGWGHVLGDRGSAAWVGLQGLQAGLGAHDGTSGGSRALLEAGIDRFGPVAGWPRLVMTSADAPELLAGFARDVTGLAHVDPVASGICGQAGRHLASSLLAAADELDAPVLAATGGLLEAAPIRSALDARLSAAGRQRQQAAGGALDGAMELARHLLDTGHLPEHPAYVLVD